MYKNNYVINYWMLSVIKWCKWFIKKILRIWFIWRDGLVGKGLNKKKNFIYRFSVIILVFFKMDEIIAEFIRLLW